MNDTSNQPVKKSPTLRQIVGSILGAALGVQNSKTQERDFQQTSPKVYIIGGIIFGVVFVMSLVLLVNFVLSKVTS
jgi:hypothetical protein